MILEFKDGTQVIARRIAGGPQLILGTMRDVLRIEFDMGGYTFDELRKLFRDNPNTDEIYTYTDDVNQSPTKVLVGKGYRIFVSISDEMREIANSPGSLAPITTEELFVVSIAQVSYSEGLLQENGYDIDKLYPHK